jgi:gas vesicle protein
VKKMTHTEDQMHRNGASPAVAGLVGAAIGAAVGSAATVILSDQEKRGKVMHALKGFQKKAAKTAGSLKSKTEEMQEKAEETAQRAAKTLDEGADFSKRSRKQAV